MLKQIIKECVAFFWRFTGIACVMRKIFLRNKVTIVVYHNPKPDLLKKHIEHLCRQYNFISLSKLVDTIQSKDWSHIPAQPLVLTIDDGHKDNYKLLDIFEEYRINPTIYLCSHVVNTNRHFWWKTGHPRSHELKELPYHLMLSSLRDEANYEPEKEYAERQSLNAREIAEMSAHFDFGSHTKFHPILTNCTDENCRDEIEGSKNELEILLNRPIKHFCYPNGAYGKREIELVKKSGYESARTLDLGCNGINADPYKLKVMEVEDNAGLNVLCAQISGLFPLIRHLRRNSCITFSSLVSKLIQNNRNTR